MGLRTLAGKRCRHGCGQTLGGPQMGLSRLAGKRYLDAAKPWEGLNGVKCIVG